MTTEESRGVRRMLSGMVQSGVVRILVSLGVLMLLVVKFDIVHVLAAVAAADHRLTLLALALFLASGILGALQWRLILAFHGVTIGMRGVTVRYFQGLLCNFLLPGFVGGDVVRVFQTAAQGKTAQVVASTLADRVIGLLVLVSFCFLGLAMSPAGPARLAFPIVLAVFAALAGLMLVVAAKPLGRIAHWVCRFAMPPSVLAKLRAVYLELHDLTRSPGTLASVVAVSVVVQFLRIAVNHACGAAAAIPLGFGAYALYVPLIAVVSSLPVSIGGFGVREAFSVVLFKASGVPAEQVLAYAVISTGVSIAGSLPGLAGFHLRRKKQQETATE